MNNEIAALKTLDSFIEYCKTTKDSEWALDVVRTAENKQNCLFGHLVNWYYGKNYTGNCLPIMDVFEEMWSSTFFVYRVNDGQNASYRQPTAKARCIALLENLASGKELTTYQSMDADMEEINRRECLTS